MPVEVYANNVQVKEASTLPSYNIGAFDLLSISGGAFKKMSRTKLEDNIVADGVGLSNSVEEMATESNVLVIDLASVRNGDLVIAKDVIEGVSIDPTENRHFYILFTLKGKDLTLTSSTKCRYYYNIDVEDGYTYLADVMVYGSRVFFRTTKVDEETI